MKEPLPLSEGQREIMEIVWDLGEASVFEVREVISEYREVSRNTIRTTMERMEEKGWLTHRVVGRTHFYSPLVERDVSLGRRVMDIVDNACGGKPELLMTALLNNRDLTAEEVKRIKALLDQASRKKSKSKGKR